MGRMGRRSAWSALAALTLFVWVAAAGTLSAQLPTSNEFILRAPAARIQDIAARHGLTVIRQLEGQDVFLVRRTVMALLNGATDPDGQGLITAAISEVTADTDVVHFEPNAIVVTPEVASAATLNGSLVAILDALSDRSLVSYFDDQVWSGYVHQPATAAIGLSATREAGGTGAGIVAVIDTGVDPNHPVLAGSLVPGYDFVHETAGSASEWTDLDGSLVAILDGSLVAILDQVSPVTLNGSLVAILDQATATGLNPALLPPAFGHGTMVAGLVHLVAPTARIMPLKAFRADGTSTVFDVVRAIYYAVENGARVINMSFSATGASPEITHAINFATSRGVICVASAGNLGQEVLVYPGALRNVIGVGSTSSTNPPTRSSFSNYGDALVSFGAPGEAVITIYPGGGYAGAWGTSFSAPLVAGGVALLLQVDPTLDQAKASNLLGQAEPMQGGMGNGRMKLSGAIQTVSDRTAPTITLITPTGGGAVFGSVRVSASASDNVRVAGVRFLLDDNPLGAETTTEPFELAWMTTAVSNGSHKLTAIARDGAGNQSSSIVNVTVSNDTAAPTVALTSPAAGVTLSGTVTVTATASDDLEVFGVRFTVDGAPLGAEDTVVPYEATWTTTPMTNGPHTVAAIARDAAGHETAASAVVTVVNDSTAPTVALETPADGVTVGGIVALLATASDEVGVAGVQFRVDGALVGTEDTISPYQVLWNTVAAGNGPHTVTAVARDVNGHTTTTSAGVIVVNDTTAPTVALTNPASGATVGGSVTLAAAAADDAGVVSVLFLLDGMAIGAADTAPFELTWTTGAIANGTHTVTAVASDAAGNQSTAASVSVTVANDTAAPTVALTNPAAGATLSGVATLAATASDDVGIVAVQFTVDGVVAGTDTDAPYEMLWHTADAVNGQHTVRAVARDGAGRETAASAEVIVLNAPPPPTLP
jgi:hypothetical protein